MNYLADVNVWIALAAVGHVHHSIALAWFEEPQTSQILFSRITQMGLLRLLTNRKVMGENILTSAEAWRVYATLCDDDRVHYAEEPPHLEDRWRQAATHFESGPNFWTDAYLAAFAEAGDYTIVTFDRGFRRHGGLDVRLLTAAV
jgi:toxin-antitoxin system PIN domain toxin